MRTAILIMLLSLALRMNSSESVNIECKYETTSSYTSLPSAYKCRVQNTLNIVTHDATVIDSVNGTHLSGKTNNDVTFFYLHQKGTANFFPRGLEKIFPNLKGIYINHAQLKEIHQTDLKPFTDLVHIDLDSNDLTFLEAGLFDFNKNLEYIRFCSNKLVHIDHGVFEKLEKLKYLYLQHNPCIDKYVSDNSSAVKNLVQELSTKCKSPDVLLIRKELEFLEDPKLTVRLETFLFFERRLEKLEETFKNSAISSHEPVKERLRKLSESKFREVLSQSSESSQSANKELLGEIQAMKNMQHDLTTKMTALTDKLSIREDMQSDLTAKVTDLASQVAALNEKMSKMTVAKNAVVSVGCDRKNY